MAMRRFSTVYNEEITPPFKHAWVAIQLVIFQYDTAGRTLVGNECRTEREIDETVDEMIEDLNAAREVAKAKLKGGSD
jgi:hypothetical protein